MLKCTGMYIGNMGRRFIYLEVSHHQKLKIMLQELYKKFEEVLKVQEEFLVQNRKLSKSPEISLIDQERRNELKIKLALEFNEFKNTLAESGQEYITKKTIGILPDFGFKVSPNEESIERLDTGASINKQVFH